MLLNNEWVNNEIKEEIQRYLEKNEYENKQPKNLWDIAKVSTKREIHSITACLKEQEKAQIHDL